MYSTVQYGTMKTEVYTHMEDGAQVYYHYEIITRWWPTEAKDGTQWQHTIIRIDRQGTVERYEDMKDYSGIWEHYEKWLQKQPLEWHDNYSEGRSIIAEQHRYIVRMVMG